MKEWFQGLTQRERVMVQVTAVVLVIFILYLVVIAPISNSYSRNKKNVESATETLAWMRSAATEVKSIQSSGGAVSGPQGKQFVLSTIDRSAKKAGLAAVMKRVQPEGESGVRVWFENAAFDELIKWLAMIETKHGLLVNEINVEQTESSGLVNVRVFLES